ncbi:MAG: MFS transporter [Synergistales bacterium]|nr:MFS transporter [Synergistales bacterium]
MNRQVQESIGEDIGVSMKTYRLLIFKFFTANFAIMSLSNVYYLLAPYLKMYGIVDPGVIGWILGSYYAASTFSRPLVVRLVEKYGIYATMVGAACVNLISSAGVALAGPSIPLVLFWRIFTGIASSLFLVSITTYQVISVPDEIRGSSFAIVSAGCIAPLVTAVPLADWLLHHGHPIAYIWLGPVVSLLSLFLVISFQKDVDLGSKKQQDWGSYSEVFRLASVRALFISILFFSFTDACILSLAGLAMEKGLVASSFISANAALSVFIRLFLFRHLDRLPRMKMAASMISITSVALFLCTFAGNNLIFMICGILFGLGMGYGFPMHLALAGDVAPPNLRPKVTSLVWFIMALSFFFCPLIIGYLSALFDYQASFRLISGLIFLAAPFIHIYLWKPVSMVCTGDEG